MKFHSKDNFTTACIFYGSLFCLGVCLIILGAMMLWQN